MQLHDLSSVEGNYELKVEGDIIYLSNFKKDKLIHI